MEVREPELVLKYAFLLFWWANVHCLCTQTGVSFYELLAFHDGKISVCDTV